MHLFPSFPFHYPVLAFFSSPRTLPLQNSTTNLRLTLQLVKILVLR